MDRKRRRRGGGGERDTRGYVIITRRAAEVYKAVVFSIFTNKS